MKRIEFDCTLDVAEEMIDLYNTIDDSPVISAYGGYDFIKTLLEDMIILGVPISFMIELDQPYVSGYDREFCLSLDEEGVSVEKCYLISEDKEGYLYSEPDVALVHEECCASILNHIGSKAKIEVGMIDDEIDDDRCDLASDDVVHTVLSESEDGHTNGFTQSWSDGNSYYSRSFYSSNEELVKQFLKEWNESF